MIPLVSAKREVELVRNRIDAVAAAVRNERGTDFTYKLGVMVETPRATLRADDIAQHSAFLSFGTNDLTQMTYGLSRDDAGRFMSDYVNQGVFPEDPFHTLDTEGVGELLRIGVDRARQVDPEMFCRFVGNMAVALNPSHFVVRLEWIMYPVLRSVFRLQSLLQRNLPLQANRLNPAQQSGSGATIRHA